MKLAFSILLHGEYIAGWIFFGTGIAMIISILKIQSQHRQNWIGISGLLVVFMSTLIFIHYFRRDNGDTISQIIRVLYETFPGVAERLLE